MTTTLAAVTPREATVTVAPSTGLRRPKYSAEKEANRAQSKPSSTRTVVRPGVPEGRLAMRRLLHKVVALLNAHTGGNSQPGGAPGGVWRSL